MAVPLGCGLCYPTLALALEPLLRDASAGRSALDQVPILNLGRPSLSLNLRSLIRRSPTPAERRNSLSQFRTGSRHGRSGPKSTSIRQAYLPCRPSPNVQWLPLDTSSCYVLRTSPTALIQARHVKAHRIQTNTLSPSAHFRSFSSMAQGSMELRGYARQPSP